MAIRFDNNNNSEEWKMLFEKISNKLIANALVTQKAPSDTSHDDDLD
ncbi:hypothetical protein HpDR95_09390 [Helicobacter pylori]